MLPTEHGSWIWWIGPFIVGSAAGGSANAALIVLALAALCAFLLRQPAAILVKTYSGRRPARDRTPAGAWAALYATVTAASVLWLTTAGFARILLLALPGVPVFVWHLWLISQRGERGQRGIELAGSGVLALAAPAAYWVAGGSDASLPWLLWLLLWLQSAASIVQIYLRLEQRGLSESPGLQERLAMASRSLAYHGFNLALSGLLAVLGGIPPLMSAGYALMLADAIEGALRPPVGSKPSRIGLRQLLASSAFMALAALSFWTR